MNIFQPRNQIQYNHTERQWQRQRPMLAHGHTLGMGLEPIFKRHHRLTLAADAAARCGYTSRELV